VETLDFTKYLGGVAVAKGPVFKLPLLALGENGYYSLPLFGQRECESVKKSNSTIRPTLHQEQYYKKVLTNIYK
jgi:hypothetical protein